MMFPNWFKDAEKYFRHVPNVPLRALQVGTYTGDATEWLLKNREVERIHDVDTWEGSEESDHKSLNFSSIESYYDSRFDDLRIVKCKMTSDQFFINNKETFNFIYIDGDHTATQTAIDGLNAFKWLETGGVMAFDDYGWFYKNDPFLEPKNGVDAFLHICKDKIQIIDMGYQVWVQKL